MLKGRIIVLSLFVALSFPFAAFAVPSGKVITWPGGGRGRVVFEGKEHAEKGYTCNSCHPGLFQMKKGAATMTMDALNKGRYCGACHNGTVAFSTNDPGKCHECHKGAEKETHHHKKKRHHDN